MPKCRIGLERKGRHPWEDHTDPKKKLLHVSISWGVHGDWRGIWGDQCKHKACMSCNTPSHMCGSWFLPRFLFRGGSLTAVHPIHYGEVIQLDGMPWSLGMVRDWGGSPEMFLEPVPKISASFPYVFHCTSQVVTPLPIDDTSFVYNTVPVLRSHQ